MLHYNTLYHIFMYSPQLKKIMLKTIAITGAFILTSLIAYNQDYEKQFTDFSIKNDTTGQIKVLNSWAAASPENPELFIAFFNFYVKKSIIEVVSLDRTQKEKILLLYPTQELDSR